MTQGTLPLGPRLPLAPPGGMEDFVYPESSRRTAITSQLLYLFEQHGYELVITPPFEHAEVIERGLDAVRKEDLLRFVEPGSGEVALLRPDMTPQIARIVATHLAQRAAPWRLCYQGTVFRRSRGRARKQQQVGQVGVECVGLTGLAADVESIALADLACSSVGLDHHRIELGHVRIGHVALEAVPESHRR
ncbi:MAG: ATP phosphoribosyltransferase regulatory subunit, partial [Myxococcales bacterium]|nr:ATP phosphoribosyltransferase regulatory subunit [Myxococcales bacterium]